VVPAPGATVVLVPAEQSADLRAWHAKHTKTDRLVPSCWLGCRCCTPMASTQRPPTGPVIRSSGA
jgi:hypothetical protein